MSAAFRRKGRTIHLVKIPHSSGEWVNRTTDTRDSVLAGRMQAMVDELGPTGAGERAAHVLDSVIAGEFSLKTLYAHWIKSGRRVEALAVLLKDVDIEPRVKEWALAPGGKKHKSADTIAHYLVHVRGLIPEGKAFLKSEFTTERIQEYIDTVEVSAATKRKAGAAISSFGAFLNRKGILKDRVLRDIVLPQAPEPDPNYLDTDDAIRLADAKPSIYSEFDAFLSGSGADVSPALRLRARDFDTKNREAIVRGTKTHSRCTTVRIADWAWPRIAKLLKGKLPDARVFEGIPDRYRAGKVHRKAISELVKQFPVYQGYTLKHHRHTYAVRAIRAGTPAEIVARQLGHKNAVLVLKVYGRFVPKQEERNRWERIAAAQDQAARGVKK